ncbi:AAA family ATPase [Microbispora siamensis]
MDIDRESAMALIERQEEMSCLKLLVAGAVLGRGRVALVGGPVGTGKSAVLRALSEQATDLGAVSVSATGSRTERRLRLGVLRRLLHDAPLSPEERREVGTLLREGVPAVSAGSGSPVGAEVAYALVTVLLRLSERHPLVITVDDVHHADADSLRGLSHLAQLARNARLVAVFAHDDRHGTDGHFETDLLRLPHCRRLHLAPLSPKGTTALVATHVGLVAAERFTGEWYAISGGNPLLAVELAADHRQFLRTAEEPPREPVIGDRFVRAVQESLRRGHPQTMRVAHGLAVHGETDGLDEMLELPAVDVSRELITLGAAGLLKSHAYRHEAVRSAVLAGMDLSERRELYRRTAVLAYARGMPPGVVADRLLQAAKVEAPWVVPTLEEAALTALRDGEAEAAVACLKLALRECADERSRARIMILLLRAEWRINPAVPVRHLDRLIEAVRRGGLGTGDALVLTRALLWHGRTEEAREVLERLDQETAATDHETAAELVVTRLWLRVTHPPLVAHLGTPPREHILTSRVPAAVSRRLEATTALVKALTRGPCEPNLDAAERILEGSGLDEVSLDVVENSLLALTYGGRCERAAPLCEVFVDEASARRSSSRYARLAGIRAEIAVRQGDMPAAERHARSALEAIPMSSWGVAIGGPLSSLILALVAMGRHDAVREPLHRPVDKAMFRSRYGLHYLYARGRHNLARESFTSAMHDFLHCGELMTVWGLDNPALLPWRADAAEACLRLGRTEEAERLITAHLDACGPKAHRERGIGLRLKAAVSDPARRPVLLRQATEHLQFAGDRYELARALLDLAASYDAVGEHRRARIVAGRARAAARKYGAEPITGRPGREADAEALPAQPPGELLGVLSGAQRRVAALAAAGYSNREIAAKLYITVSTVEQHLTHTYRKLNIRRRAELPLVVEFDDETQP